MSERLTASDKRTLAAALCDAMRDRESYADSYSYEGKEAKDALALIKKYEALHQKVLGRESAYKTNRDRERNAPRVSIFDL